MAELAQVTMEVTTLAGENVSTLVAGQEYYLKAQVKDLRSVSAQGVSAAFFDVAVNNNGLITVEDQTGAQSQILFSGEYPLAHTGSNLIESSSEFDEVGAATLSQYGAASTPFFQVKFKADAAGQLNFSANAAETIGNVFSLAGGGDLTASEIAYGSVTVDIIDPISLVDDVALRVEDAAQSTIDVLANDVGGSTRWTIQSVSNISGNGSVQVAADGKSILYTPGSNAVGVETFTYATLDTNGIAGKATVTITLDAQNDLPVNTVPGAQIYDAATRSVTFSAASKISVDDVDVGNGNVRVTLFVDSGVINLSSTTGLTFLNGSANNTRYLLFDGTKADVNVALDGLTYTANAGVSADVLTIDTHDLGNSGAGGAKVDRDTIALTIQGSVGVNQSPVNTVPLAQIYNSSDRLVTFTGATQISVDDPDIGNQTMRVTLFVNSGVISLNSTAGLSFLNGSANNTRYLLFDGTKADINTALADMTYTADVGVSGDVLTIDTHDLGHTGTGGAKIDRDQVILTLAGSTANQAPINTVPLARFFTEGDRTITFGNLSRVKTFDPDAGNQPVRVTLFVNSGVINLSQTSGLSFVSGANGTKYLLFDGTVDDVNAAMLNMTYTANANVTSDTLTLDVHDLGHSGTGGYKTDRDTVALALVGTLPNITPVNIVPGPQTYSDADPTVNFGLLNPVATFDADAGGQDLRVTLFVNQGTISLNTTQGLTFLNGSANNTRYLLFDGSQDDINAAMLGMTYTANNGSTGDVLTIDTHDLGHSGSGGAKIDRDTVTITRVAVNGRAGGGGSGESGSSTRSVSASTTARSATSVDAVFALPTMDASEDGASRLSDSLASANSGRSGVAASADSLFANQA